MADTSYDITGQVRVKTKTFCNKNASSCHWQPVTEVKIAYTMGFTENLVKTLNIQTFGFLNGSVSGT